MANRDVSVEMAELHFADPSLMLDLAVLAQRFGPKGGNCACAGRSRRSAS